MERYKPPSMTANEIFLQLKHSLGVPISSEEEITKPKSDTIREIYLHMLSTCLHKSRDQIVSYSPQELATLRYPDTEEVAQANIKTFMHLKHIFSRIDNQEDGFRLMDLLNPDFKRTRRFLSAFINYLKLMTEEEKRLVSSSEDYVKARISMEKLVSLKEEKNNLVSEIQVLNKRKAELKPLVDQKLQEFKEIECEKAKVAEERKALEEKVEKLMDDVEKCKKAISELEIWNEDLEEGKKKLEEMIVNDPEQYLAQIEENERKVENLTKNEIAEQKKEKDAKNKVEKVASVLSQLREVSTLLQTIEISKNKHKELLHEVEVERHHSLELEKELHSLKLQEDTIDDKIEEFKAKWENVKNVSENQIFMAEKSLHSKIQEREYEEKNSEHLVHELNLKAKELGELEDQFRLMEEKHVRAMKELKEVHEKTVEKAKEYSRKVLQVIENHEFYKIIAGSSDIKLD